MVSDKDEGRSKAESLMDEKSKMADYVVCC